MLIIGKKSQLKKWSTVIMTSVALWMVSHTSSQAALTAYEDFDYTPGNIDGLNGGTGFSGAWGNFFGTSGTVGTGGLSDPGTPGVPSNGNGYTGGSSSGGAIRSLSTTFTDGDTFYVSFLIQPDFVIDSSGSAFAQVRLDGTNGDIAIGTTNAGGGQWQMRQTSPNGSVVLSSILPTQGVTALLVAEVQLQAGNDIVSLYVDPTAGAPQPGSAAAILNSEDFGTIQGVATAGGLPWQLDEIRIGTTFGDVTPVPEPSTYALLLGGMGVLYVLRRKKGTDKK